MSGVFVTFEGTEGSGKSTQQKILAEHLEQLGFVALCLREPGGTVIGEEIRQSLKQPGRALSPETELLLMNASRAQLLSEKIRPALARGEIVLCDRFYDSTFAYQGYGRGLSLAAVRSAVALAVGDTHPDRTLFFQVPLSVSQRRSRLRNRKAGQAADRFEEEATGFFERVEKGYLALASDEPDRIKVIDGTASQKAVAREVWKWVEPLITNLQPRR